MSFKNLICLTITLLFLLSITAPLGAWDGRIHGIRHFDNRGHPWQDDNQDADNLRLQFPRIPIIIGPFIKAINIEAPTFLKKIIKKKKNNGNNSALRTRLDKKFNLRGADTR